MPVYERNEQCLRTGLLGINGILMLYAIIMVIAGFTISVDFHYQVAVLAKEMNVNNTVIRWLAIGLAVNGIGVFVVAFLGLIGAVKLRKGCLIVYVLILIVIIIAHMIIGIATASLKSWVNGVSLSRLKKNLLTEYGGNRSLTDKMNMVQFRYGCCGFRDFKDYEGSIWAEQHRDRSKNQTVPKACCVPKNKAFDAWSKPVPIDELKCYRNVSGYLRHKGCYGIIKDYLNRNSNTLIGIGFSGMILEIFALVLALFLFVLLLWEGNTLEFNDVKDVQTDVQEDVPTEDVPKEDVPTEDVPKEDVPTEDVPKEDVPTEDVPTEDVPKEDAQKDIRKKRMNETFLISSPYIPLTEVSSP